jgi:peptidoglycan/xylan/chitin deacetylase (PgdA/CDA1 family)
LTVPLALAAVVAYFGYEALEAPGNQLFGKTVVQGAPTDREVALTFDDGPNPPYTDRILDVLHEEHVHATFFVVGRAVVAYPATMRRIVRDGNAVGNHTWDHGHMIVAIQRITGVRTHLMRPPFGARDFAVISEAHKLGYRVVMWSVPLPDDWDQPGVGTIASRIVDNVTDGSIIVLHDGNRGIVCRDHRYPARTCDRSQEVAATREIVRTLHARRFRFVTIPQLISDAQLAAATHIAAR